MATTSTNSDDIKSCTLIYALNSNATITFNQFYLIVRSLHVYKVKNIIKKEDQGVIEVTLDYNCSMKTVRAKLGNVPGTVTKQNPFVSSAEVNELEKLRAELGFGLSTEEEEYETSRPAKKPRFKK